MFSLVALVSILVFIVSNLAQIPNDIRILATDKDFIHFSWMKPLRSPTNVYGYTIKYRAINSNQPWLVKQTSETQIVLNELRPITKYEIILQPYFNSSYTDSSGPSTRIEVTTDETGNFLFE